MDTIVSEKLAIYYGYPSGVNATFSVPLAAGVFGQYNQCIWGDTLENPTHPDHANAVAIIADPQMAHTEVYGYIDSTLALATLQTNIDNWVLMGVKGIMCDKFGYDWAVSRAAQNALVDYIHSKGVKAFVNAFHIDDACSTFQNATYNPNRDACHLRPGDWYLAESLTLANDVYVEQSMIQSRVASMAKYQKSLGINMASTTTTASGVFDQAKFDFAYFTTMLWGFRSCSWGEQFYSASSGSLPMRTRKTFYGTEYVSNPQNLGDQFQRTVNIGFRVNFTTHTVDTLLQ
jgi:hypothetical protein